MGRFGRGRKQPVNLRMAPMIDMIFVFLIFFLVVSRWRPQEDVLPLGLSMSSINASSPAAARPEPLVVNIDAADGGCRIKVGGYAVDVRDDKVAEDMVLLMDRMKDCLSMQKRSLADPIEIASSPQVRWENVAQVYNLFYGAGLKDITFRMTE